MRERVALVNERLECLEGGKDGGQTYFRRIFKATLRLPR